MQEYIYNRNDDTRRIYNRNDDTEYIYNINDDTAYIYNRYDDTTYMYNASHDTTYIYQWQNHPKHYLNWIILELWDCLQMQRSTKTCWTHLLSNFFTIGTKRSICTKSSLAKVIANDNVIL